MNCLKRIFPIMLILILIFALQPKSPIIGLENKAYIINWQWVDGKKLPQGASSSIEITITNVSNGTMQLWFVGLRFDWMKPNVFLIGSGSERNKTLERLESISYSIAFSVPENVSLGLHEAIVLVDYSVRLNGEWSNRTAVAHPIAIEVIKSTKADTFDFQRILMDAFIIVLAVLAIELARSRIKSRKNKSVQTEPFE